MGCCCSSEEVKNDMLINKLFINDDLGRYDRSLLSEIGTCSFCKKDGVSVIYKWIGNDYIYICEYCELDILEKLRDIM